MQLKVGDYVSGATINIEQFSTNLLPYNSANKTVLVSFSNGSELYVAVNTGAPALYFDNTLIADGYTSTWYETKIDLPLDAELVTYVASGTKVGANLIQYFSYKDGIHIGNDGFVLKFDGNVIPYPSEVKPTNAVMRTVSPTRTALLNIDYGGGKVKAVPSYELTWAFLSLSEYARLDAYHKQKAIAQEDVDFYCLNTATNEMVSFKAYIQDDGFVIGGVQYTYDKQKGGTKLIGYKNVTTTIIATLNDDQDVIAANQASYGEDELIEGV